MRALVIAALLASGCGSEDPSTDKGESIFPVAVGNKWVYQIDSGDEPLKTQTITGTTADGAFIFETVRGLDGQRTTVSLQKLDDENRLVRLSEYSTFMGDEIERITFTPYDIRVDTDDYALGESYEQTFLEDHDPSDEIADVRKEQKFEIESVDELITVPAGTFRTIKIRRSTTDGPGKVFWYAKGVGKVQEAGGQLEQLTTVELEGGVAP